LSAPVAQRNSQREARRVFG